MIFGRVLVFLVAAEVSGSPVKYTGRVVNGEDANISDFPFYGALVPKWSMFLDSQKTHLATTCGSSLISPQFFITAYHCFLRHADPMYWVVILGIKNRCQYDGKGRVLEVSWIYQHPQARISSTVKMNDIALMVVSKPVTDVTPLALPLEPPRVNEKGYIVGFGLSKITTPKGNVEDMACRPQKALEYVPEQSTCIKPKDTVVGAFCIKDLKNRQAAACRGDSGGPFLVLRNGLRTLLGVSSFGDALCKPSSNSDYFTDVHIYVRWINKVLHEPPPEGYMRRQENIHQFEPFSDRADDNSLSKAARYVNESDVSHASSIGGESMDDKVPGLSPRNYNIFYVVPYASRMYYRQGTSGALDPVGPRWAPLISMVNPPTNLDLNSAKQFQTQYRQQQPSGPFVDNGLLANQVVFNRIANTAHSPQMLKTQSYSFGPHTPSQGYYQFQATHPQTQTTRDIRHPWPTGIFLGYT